MKQKKETTVLLFERWSITLYVDKKEQFLKDFDKLLIKYEVPKGSTLFNAIDIA